MPNAQEWLDKNYPQENRKNITKLDLVGKSLTSSLNCTDFVNLEELYCFSNNLTNLTINNCPNLKEINCEYNQLTNLELSNNLALTKLNCYSNPLTTLTLTNNPKLKEIDCNYCRLTDLTPFSNLVNCERIDLRDNPLTGSLAPLAGLGKLWWLDIRDTQLDSGLEYLPESLKSFDCKETKLVRELEKLGDSNSLLRIWKGWKSRGFTPQQAKSWIEAGLSKEETDFAAYLRDKHYFDSSQNLNWKQIKKVSIPAQEYLDYCYPKEKRKTVKYLDIGKRNLTGSLDLSDFTNLEKIYYHSKTNLIPHKQFSDIEFLAKGGFGKVYKASWNNGNNRRKDVVLKSLNSSRNITIEFLRESVNHSLYSDNEHSYIVPFHGISQDPITKNYLMVMKYMEGGNLRDYLKNNPGLGFRGRLRRLSNIATGLKEIHENGLTHRDFHSGNILSGGLGGLSYITDLGLCRPADETSQEKVFGVLPYVAPEVLQGQPYTQASDVYSFGMVAYELFSGLPPYLDLDYDACLALKICDGQRPKFKFKIPQLLEDLINRCWDKDPNQRPTASELEVILNSWYSEVGKEENTEFSQQCKEIEKEYNKSMALISTIISDPEKLEKLTSKLLPTKEINQLMQNFDFRTKTSELNTQLIKAKELAKEITMKQKYQDFKKVLKLVLEKSEELETIITTNQLVISDDLKEALTKIKELKAKSQEKDNAYQELSRKKLSKEKELTDLKKVIIINNKLEEDDLEDLLEDQDQAAKETNEKTAKKLERTKKRLAEKITEIEIIQLCQLQMAITQLELKLNQNIEQSTKQLTTIINNITNVTAYGGTAIGQVQGDFVNKDKTVTESQAQTLQPQPKP